MPRAAWHRVHSRLLSTQPGMRTVCLDQLFPTRKPPSSLPCCCSTARRITLHLELTYSDAPQLDLVAASRCQHLCSPSMLPPHRGWECRLQEVGRGGPGQDCPSTDCPLLHCSQAAHSSPARPCRGEAARQGLAGQVGSPPAHLYV